LTGKFGRKAGSLYNQAAGKVEEETDQKKAILPEGWTWKKKDCVHFKKRLGNGWTFLNFY